VRPRLPRPPGWRYPWPSCCPAAALQLLAEATGASEAHDIGFRFGPAPPGGHPVALLTAAAGAQLLAVGSRGLGGLAGMRLGSVVQAVLHHSPCLVAVVHPDAGQP
jgi:nucleotide-binding universal stress UspA family protein